MHVSGINKSTLTHNYQSTMSLLVIDFTYLEGKGGEPLVKEVGGYRIP